MPSLKAGSSHTTSSTAPGPVQLVGGGHPRRRQPLERRPSCSKSFLDQAHPQTKPPVAWQGVCNREQAHPGKVAHHRGSEPAITWSQGCPQSATLVLKGPTLHRTRTGKPPTPTLTRPRWA